MTRQAGARGRLPVHGDVEQVGDPKGLRHGELLGDGVQPLVQAPDHVGPGDLGLGATRRCESMEST